MCSTPRVLVGIDGCVSLSTEEAGHVGLLRDAGLHATGDTVPVPFSTTCLRAVADFCAQAVHKQQALGGTKSTSEARGQSTDSSCDRIHVIDESGTDAGLLFETLRAANFLECDGLLEATCWEVAQLMGSLCSWPDRLASVLGIIPPASPGTDDQTYLPYSTSWVRAVNEPVLTAPTAGRPMEQDGHATSDEDALALALLKCEANALRHLKGISVSWGQRARTTLCDTRWLEAQRTLNLDWALGNEVPALAQKRWACAVDLCLAMPKLEVLALHHYTILLAELRDRVSSITSRSVCAQSSTAYPGHGRPWAMDEGNLYLQRPGLRPAPYGGSGRGLDHATTPNVRQHQRPHQHAINEMVKGPESLQLVAAMYVIAHSSVLLSADLSGFLPKVGPSLPPTLIDTIARAVRAGHGSFRSIVLYRCVHRIDHLRAPSGEHAAAGQAHASISYSNSDMCVADITFACRAGSDLAHVAELDLSSSDFGDAGLVAFVAELPAELSADAPMGWESMMPRRLWPNLLADLRVLSFDDCDISDYGASVFAGALRAQALTRLEHLSFMGNRIGDGGIQPLLESFGGGALVHLVHLNFGHNEITDLGGAGLAEVLAYGGLPKLIQLSLAVNRIGDETLVAMAHAAFSEQMKARLEYLGLGANQIGDRGAIALGKALGHADGLAQIEGLWLADNPAVGDPGIVAVVDGLSMRGIIQDLYLHGLNVKQEGCDAVIRALPNLPELRKCILGRVSLRAQRQLEWAQEEMRAVLRRQDYVVASWPMPNHVTREPARRPVHPTEARRRRKSRLCQSPFARGARVDNAVAGNHDPYAGIVVHY